MEKSMTFHLSTDQVNALKKYAAENGRCWKSQLRHDWDTGKAYGELQMIRNNFGPSWLVKFSFTNTKTWTKQWGNMGNSALDMLENSFTPDQE